MAKSINININMKEKEMADTVLGTGYHGENRVLCRITH